MSHSFTVIQIFGHNFFVDIYSAIFLMQMDLNPSLRCSIEVNENLCFAIIKVSSAPTGSLPLTTLSFVAKHKLIVIAHSSTQNSVR